VKPVSLSPDEVRLIEPRFDLLEETPIQWPLGNILGWHVNAISGESLSLGSGLATKQDTARRIALAETIERAVFRSLKNSQNLKEFRLDEYPTTCGFAAGFEHEKTRLRSICEAVERWARALWVDQNYALMKVPPSAIFLSGLGQYFLEPFSETLYFSGSFSVEDPIRKVPIHLKLAVVIGLTGIGAFPGSRVCSNEEDPWEHACLEAWRHHLIFARQSLPRLAPNSYLHRINYFGSRRDEALSKINQSHNYKWPMPKIILHKSHTELSKKISIWRSLCDHYEGWQNGQISRFVY
jgi:hypothetical protein